jgi:chemotaxis protein CheC
MPKIDKLNEDQLDVIQETGNIGCSHAATAVSQMIGKTVDISVPNLQIEKIAELNNSILRIFDKTEKVVGVYLELTDEFKGSILFLFPFQSALSLADVLVGQPPGTANDLDEMAESAITEVGNIVVSAYTNALGNLLNETVMLSTPTFTYDMPEGVLEKVYGTLGKDATHALIFDIKFSGENDLFTSYFVLLPSPKSLENLIEKLIPEIQDESDEDVKAYAASLAK